MIVFEGKLCDDVSGRELKKCVKTLWILSLAALLVLTYICVLFVFKDQISGDLFVGSCFLAVIFGIFYLTGLALMAYEMDKLKKNFPKRITIAKNEYISSEYCDKTMRYYSENIVWGMEDVTDVQDQGDYYVIYFSAILRLRKFICQKDLLVEGALEEFEALFDDKLYRK